MTDEVKCPECGQQDDFVDITCHGDVTRSFLCLRCDEIFPTEIPVLGYPLVFGEEEKS